MRCIVLAAFVSGVVLGLVSLPHCAAMCGPLATFASLEGGSEASLGRAARYQLGRTTGYALLGALAGAVGAPLTSMLPLSIETLASASLALALGIAAVRIWPTALGSAGPALVGLGTGPRAPSVVERWTHEVVALGQKLPREPIALGLVAALLPCGVLASGVLVAAGSGSVGSGLATMAGLSLGSGAGLFAVVAALRGVPLRADPRTARALAIVLGVGALILVARPFLVTSTGACHAG